MLARNSQRKLCLLSSARRRPLALISGYVAAIRAASGRGRAIERASYESLLGSYSGLRSSYNDGMAQHSSSLTHTVRLHAHAWRGAWASRIPYIIHPPLPSSSVCESRGGRACMFPRIVANRPSIPKEPFTAFLKANRDFHCTYNAARL